MREDSILVKVKNKVNKVTSLAKVWSSFLKKAFTKDSFLKIESMDLVLWSLKKVTFIKDNGRKGIKMVMESFMMLNLAEFMKDNLRMVNLMGLGY